MNINKKNMKWVILVLCVAILAGIGTVIYDFYTDKSITIGSVEKSNGNEISMSYQLFNGEKEYSMTLEKGDTLQIDILSQSGKLDMRIAAFANDENYQYHGTDIPTSSFSVHIKETGKYRIAVTGHDHKGSYSVVKKQQG